MAKPIQGRPPTAHEELLRAAAGSLSAVDATARIDDYAKTLLTTVTLVGTVLTGLGTIAGATLVREGSVRILIAASVVCAVASALLALKALRGASTMVNISNDDALLRWLRRNTEEKARVARFAGVLLTSALIFAVAGAVLVLAQSSSPQLVPSVTVSAAGKGSLQVQISGNGLPPSSTVAAETSALPRDGNRQLLGRQVSAVKADGTMTMTMTITELPADLRAVEVEVDHARVTCQIKLDLLPPAPAVESGLRCEQVGG